MASVNRFKKTRIRQQKLLSDIGDIDQIYDLEVEYTEAKKAGRAFSNATIHLSYEFNSQLYNVAQDFTTEFLRAQVVGDQIGIQYADATVDSRRAELKRLLERAIIEGDSIDEFTEDLSDYFVTLRGTAKSSGVRNWRARRIARTETGRVMDRSAMSAFNQIGVRFIDVVGCDEAHEPWDCLLQHVPIEEIPNLNFHPNHTGSVVPTEEWLS